MDSVSVVLSRYGQRFDVRFTPGSGHSARIALKVR